MKEVICLANGDSQKISTWSGIPYFFIKTLEQNGIVVHRIDISPSNNIRSFYDKTIRRLIRLFSKNTTFCINNSIYNFFHVSALINKSIHKYKEADSIISFSYLPFWSSTCTKKIYLFCDWTLQYFIEERLHRAPDLFERLYIYRENRMIHKSDFTFSLFKGCAEYIKIRTRSKNIYSINGNVINAVYPPNEQIVHNKKRKQKIVFIGRNHYLEGLNSLLEAFPIIQCQYPQIELDVIGINIDACDISLIVPGINFYGYLNKDIPEECDLFYDILNNASLVVNPNVGWAGYTSLIEAMYYYTPIVTAKFNAFISDFGEHLEFGEYCTPDDVSDKILQVLSSPLYLQYCHNAHEKVKSFTWDNYLKQFLLIIRQ